MTATVTPPGRHRADAEQVPAVSPDRRLLRAPVVVLAAALGTVIVGLSYRLSAQGYPANTYYLVFWVGMVTAMVPAAVKLTATRTPDTGRLALLLLVGALTAMPKFLRNPTGPRYHDEYAHWREAVDVLLSGRLFPSNSTIPIVEFFPGTSALTAVSHSFTGLSVWLAGIAVVFTMHAMGLFAVYVIGARLLDSGRAGAIAALVYAVNPSSIYFDTQYAYESIAINFFLWTLALTVLAAQPSSARRRWALIAAGALSTAGCVITHHLSTLFLIVALAVVAVTVAIRRGPWRPWLASLVITVVLAAVWVAVFARPTLDYLSPYFGDSVEQLSSMAEKKGDGGRQLLAANVQPLWEQLVTAAAPLMLAGVALIALLLIRRHRVSVDPSAFGLMVFGCGFFLALPFILAPSGAEGARRSWGFTYVGVALIVALVVVHWATHRPALLSGRRLPAVLLGGLVILLIGNVGGGLNDPYRFPGPFRWGTDTNSASAEAATVARALEARVGRVNVVTDWYTALQLTAYGGMFVAAPSPGFPAWELTQNDGDPSPELAAMLQSSDYDYLVVDIRMAEQPPFNGHNYGPSDPSLGAATPMANLTRLDSVPWATRVMSTEHLRVYRLDLTDIVTGGRP
jgi:hypothetical protein